MGDHAVSLVLHVSVTQSPVRWLPFSFVRASLRASSPALCLRGDSLRHTLLLPPAQRGE